MRGVTGGSVTYFYANAENDIRETNITQYYRATDYCVAGIAHIDLKYFLTYVLELFIYFYFKNKITSDITSCTDINTGIIILPPDTTKVPTLVEAEGDFIMVIEAIKRTFSDINVASNIEPARYSRRMASYYQILGLPVPAANDLPKRFTSIFHLSDMFSKNLQARQLIASIMIKYNGTDNIKILILMLYK